MLRRATSLTAAAGEHWIAFKLSAMGYPVALTRGGSPTVDLMVGDLSGNETISIQVKTSSGALRRYSKSPANNRWEFDVGRKALLVRGANILYAFVDLQWDQAREPDVFIVPSNVVADFLKPSWKRFMFWIPESDPNKYRNNWSFITSRLTPVRDGLAPVVPSVEISQQPEAALASHQSST